MIKLQKSDSLFPLCDTCHSCRESCVAKHTEPGSLYVKGHVRDIIERRPNRHFSHLIEKFWYVPPQEGTDQRAFEIVPDGGSDLVFILGEGVCRVLLFGPFTRTVFAPIRNSREYFCIRFHPGRVPCLTPRTRPVELVNNGIYLSKLLGCDTDFLGEGLHASDSMDSRQQFVESVFTKAGLDSAVRDSQIQWLAEHVRSLQGQIRVDALASGSGMSSRTLERLFKKEMGISPKTFIRMTRFQNAVERLRKNTSGRLTDVAYASGYADQSHFIKDFKMFFGGIPSSASLLSSVAILQFHASEPL